MNPQWNNFQPSNTDSAIHDYNKYARSTSVLNNSGTNLFGYGQQRQQPLRSLSFSGHNSVDHTVTKDTASASDTLLRNLTLSLQTSNSNTFGTSNSAVGSSSSAFGSSNSPFGSSSTAVGSSSSHIGLSTCSFDSFSPFGSSSSVVGSSNRSFGSSNSTVRSSNSPLGSSSSTVGSSSSPFGSSSAVRSSSSPFGSSNSAVGSSSGHFGSSNSAIGSSNSTFGSSSSAGGSSSSAFGSSNTAVGSSNSVFGSSNSVFGSSNSALRYSNDSTRYRSSDSNRYRFSNDSYSANSSNCFNSDTSNNSNRFSENRFDIGTSPHHDIFSEMTSSSVLASRQKTYPETTFPSDFGGTFNARAITNGGAASFSSSDSSSYSRSTSSQDVFAKASAQDCLKSTDNDNQQGLRETGIIEKLLHSYGFIQCCERQARLFFHFSQFDGNIEHLKIGDPVEFEMTYDKRTGKPIASTVTKISSEILTQQVLSEERVLGTVATEIKLFTSRTESGRISYENRGECFFLPYTQNDIEGHVTLRAGDKVSFQISNNARTGNLAAVHVRLEDPAQPIRYRGIVRTVKDGYGFIERGDVVREIFFHFPSNKAGEVNVNDHVEFTIQTRNGKEISTNITKLESGSVVLEEVGTEIVKGQLLKTLEKGINLSGRIRFRGSDRSEVEIPYGEKDLKRQFTLRHGDWVQFNIAMDRRDKQKRATNLRLLDESFVVSGEKREQGVVQSIKDGFGFIRCADREPDSMMFFHFSELIDIDRVATVGDEVEFTVSQDLLMPSRYTAIRIKHLPPNTVRFDQIIQTGILGNVIIEPPSSWTLRANKHINGNEENKELDCGIITYQNNAIQENIKFFLKDCDIKNVPRLNDTVRFSIRQVKSTKEINAVDMTIVSRPVVDPEPPIPKSSPPQQQPQQQQSGIAAPVKNGLIKGIIAKGYIAALKDGYGFIETEGHDREVFFHFSNMEGDATSLELGTEVEYSLNTKTGGKLSAENVKALPKGSIPVPNVLPEVLEGTVLRPLRAMNPDQQHYAGLIVLGRTELTGDTPPGPQYEFGITSLINKREILQPGDIVQFQEEVGTKRCRNIQAVRTKLRATVEAIKDGYGFLSHEVDGGKKLFFHMSEVRDSSVSLNHGDQVEFVILTNPRTGKSSACNIIKISEAAPVSARPERLVSRLRSVSMEESGPRQIVIRQPRGPDGTRGFKTKNKNPSV